MELSPGLVDAYWDFDQNGGKLLWGLPRWLDRRPYQARERLHHMTRKYIDSAWESYDWKEPESDWEPHWGSRLSREVAKWMRQKGFSDKAQAGHTLGTLFGVHGNSYQ
ncbi:hypothetical protein B0O99DRAFT_688171 [Bisporella sp. PMI_857]|nr:hypothetical protein B0O99DRAFT_688171 [Bisporella sp. PMI_857]